MDPIHGVGVKLGPHPWGCGGSEPHIHGAGAGLDPIHRVGVGLNCIHGAGVVLGAHPWAGAGLDPIHRAGNQWAGPPLAPHIPPWSQDPHIPTHGGGGKRFWSRIHPLQPCNHFQRKQCHWSPSRSG